MAAQTYTNDQRVTVLAALAANGGNIRKTARETGVDRNTIVSWSKSDLSNSADISRIKSELQDAYMSQLKTAREKLIRRISAVAETEQDLFKLSGAFKIIAEASAEQEVQEALAAAIRERASEMN